MNQNVVRLYNETLKSEAAYQSRAQGVFDELGRSPE